MPSYVDSVMIRTLNNRFPHGYWHNRKIAVIGERNGQQRKGSLAWRIANELYCGARRNITVFTERKKFNIEDGERFDVLVAVRCCEAEELVLESAAKYGKSFALLPCECRRSQIKIVRYIREHPVIEGIESYPGKFDDGKNDSRAWMVLYAIKREV